MEVNEAKRLQGLEAENNKLNELLTDKLFEVEVMNDGLNKLVEQASRNKAAAHIALTTEQVHQAGIS
jgi:hypothetical protein